MSTDRIGAWFLRLATFLAPLGMVMGAYIGATKQFHLAPAHAHLLLIGWVSFFLVGLFYRNLESRHSRLAMLHLALAAGGLGLMFPGLLVLLSGTPEAEILVILGSTGIMVGFALFAWVVFVETRRTA